MFSGAVIPAQTTKGDRCKTQVLQRSLLHVFNGVTCDITSRQLVRLLSLDFRLVLDIRSLCGGFRHAVCNVFCTVGHNKLGQRFRCHIHHDALHTLNVAGYLEKLSAGTYIR